MQRGITAAAVLTVILFWHLPAAAGELLVVSKGEDKLGFYDTDTGALLGSADTGRDPREVVLSPDHRRAFVSDFGDIKNTISVFDVGKRSLIRRIEVKQIYGPHGLAMTDDGKSLFVTFEKSRAVARLDPASGEVVNTIKVGMKGSHYLVLSPDDSVLYVANGVDNNITLIDVAAGTVKRHILAGIHPEGMALAPDGSELWVGVQGTNEVVIIDVADTMRQVDRLHCPGSPTRLEFTPDGSRVAVTCSTMDQMFVFDANTRDVVTRIDTGRTPFDLEIGPAGEFAYVAFAADGRIGVLDLEKLEFVRDFKTLDVPAGLAYFE